jgi:hypothetical protein
MRFICLIVLAFVGLVGCAEPQPTNRYEVEVNATVPAWDQPVLGSDPDAYQRPNRRPCNGPNCPK